MKMHRRSYEPVGPVCGPFHSLKVAGTRKKKPKITVACLCESEVGMRVNTVETWTGIGFMAPALTIIYQHCKSFVPLIRGIYY